MTPRFSSFDSDGEDALGRARFLAYLDTPEGAEFLADAVHSARIELAGSDEPEFLEELRAFENRLRTESARPLPAELEL